MPALFGPAYAPLQDFEGGWCNVSGDAGGETYAGIARNFFPKWPGWADVDAAKSHTSFRQGVTAFSRHLAGLPGLSKLVEGWYRTEWWDRMQLAQFPQEVSNELFEQAVNLGRAGSGRYVQRLINAYNCRKTSTGYEKLFDDLVVDGALGPKSLQGLAVILRDRATTAEVVHALNGLQVYHYVRLAADSFTHRKFLKGWMTRTY